MKKVTKLMGIVFFSLLMTIDNPAVSQTTDNNTRTGAYDTGDDDDDDENNWGLAGLLGLLGLIGLRKRDDNDRNRNHSSNR